MSEESSAKIGITIFVISLIFVGSLCCVMTYRDVKPATDGQTSIKFVRLNIVIGKMMGLGRKYGRCVADTNHARKRPKSLNSLLRNSDHTISSKSRQRQTKPNPILENAPT